MLETPHVAVGAAIATKVVNPILAIPLAFGSHFLLEKIPHWNPHLNTETEKYGKPTQKSTAVVIIDVCASLALGFFIASKALPNTSHAATILVASFASVLPDIIEGPYFFLGIRNKFIKKWIIFQKSLQEDTNIIPGLLTQALTIFAALWWIFA
ncbi:hypothetical protein KKH23_01345 [Patescibacteria group bacterium]|nr:hypothetical protein [Patescibacteria group bacterium]MBU0777137.1 hypothetical protein [Patescibacteria group bacterium]MBU0845831.1 hypothetical protein [Patescibacteria group bacterium]MBU0922858.1 hypothetical protein [Patescibacteria group bacterium]MBU1066409.1 hypothetical protein [Patescibacteria group bacterium]